MTHSISAFGERIFAAHSLEIFLPCNVEPKILYPEILLHVPDGPRYCCDSAFKEIIK